MELLYTERPIRPSRSIWSTHTDSNAPETQALAFPRNLLCGDAEIRLAELQQPCAICLSHCFSNALVFHKVVCDKSYSILSSASDLGSKISDKW